MASAFWENIRSAFAVRSIVKHGKTRLLSRSQMVLVLIDLYEADRSLTPEQFGPVYALYKQYRADTQEKPMDRKAYFETALEMVNTFNEIAPVEQYKCR